jgi:hypothetical protein
LKLTQRSSVKDVAACVAQALTDAGIRAILSGGACASIHSGGACQSVDLDFILLSYGSPAQVDRAMATADFARRGIQYFHPRARFYVEFPPGPVSIGGDYKIEPVEIRVGKRTVWALSATDSCRDRLAAFFHWNDRQGLQTAVQIALRGEVNLEKVRSWAAREGDEARSRYAVFLAEIKHARKRRETGRRKRPGSV